MYVQPFPGSLYHNGKPMHQSPADECPTSSMPQTDDEEGDHKVYDNPYFRYPVSTQGYIDVIPDKSAQSYMPSTPEFLYVDRSVRSIEIDREPYVEHERRTECHIGIT